MSKFTWTNVGPVKAATREAAYIAALEIERDTKMNTPVDTGNLRRSYLTQEASTATQAVFMVGTNVNYAIFVELGTIHQHAQPHLGPALAKAKAKYGS